MQPRLFFISMLGLVCAMAYGQSTDKEFTGPYPNFKEPPEPKTVRTPVKKRRILGIFRAPAAKGFTYPRQNVKHSAQYEYYKRVEKAAHDRAKLYKSLAKPQYSDFLYFGHKHKPKKRPPNKMRYCVECGIRH